MVQAMSPLGCWGNRGGVANPGRPGEVTFKGFEEILHFWQRGPKTAPVFLQSRHLLFISLQTILELLKGGKSAHYLGTEKDSKDREETGEMQNWLSNYQGRVSDPSQKHSDFPLSFRTFISKITNKKLQLLSSPHTSSFISSWQNWSILMPAMEMMAAFMSQKNLSFDRLESWLKVI